MKKIKLILFCITMAVGCFSVYYNISHSNRVGSDHISLLHLEKIKAKIDLSISRGCKAFYNLFTLNKSQNFIKASIHNYKVLGGVKNIKISESIYLRVINLVLEENNSYKFSVYLYENVKAKKCYGSLL